MKGADVILVTLIQMASLSAGYPAGQKIKTKPQTVTPNAERVRFRCSPQTVGPDSTVTLTERVRNFVCGAYHEVDPCPDRAARP
jgi:hypothetical protein